MSTHPDEATIKKLFSLVRNHCCFPGCEQPVADLRWEYVNGEMCHIEGCKKTSARYRAGMTDAELRHFDNIIILCPTHHHLVDNLERDLYTVEKLQEMKARGEQHDAPPHLRWHPSADLTEWAVKGLRARADWIEGQGPLVRISEYELPETPAGQLPDLGITSGGHMEVTGMETPKAPAQPGVRGHVEVGDQQPPPTEPGVPTGRPPTTLPLTPGGTAFSARIEDESLTTDEVVSRPLGSVVRDESLNTDQTGPAVNPEQRRTPGALGTQAFGTGAYGGGGFSSRGSEPRPEVEVANRVNEIMGSGAVESTSVDNAAHPGAVMVNLNRAWSEGDKERFSELSTDTGIAMEFRFGRDQILIAPNSEWIADRVGGSDPGRSTS